MRRVTLYTRRGCHLCEAAAGVLERARGRAKFALETIDIDGDPRLRALYDEEVPVVAIDARPVFRHAVDLDEFLKRLA